MVKSRQQKIHFLFLHNKKGKIMEMTKNKRSNGRGTKSLSKSLFNSIVFGKEIIMKKIKMNKRFGLNRQKSREIVENVLSGTKAGFKSILNFEHAIERKKMENQKSKSTFSATLLTLTLMVAALGVSLAIAAEKKMVKDPTTGKMVSAPEYGGTLTFADKTDTYAPDMYHSHALSVGSVVIEKLAVVDWAIDRDKYPFIGGYQAPVYALRGRWLKAGNSPTPQRMSSTSARVSTGMISRR